MKKPARSGSLSSLRRANVKEVLSVLRRFGGMTQVELADASNLSTATISSIVRQLTAEGVVDTKSVSRNGRHALYVALARRGGICAGISLGRMDLCLALGDASGQVLCEKSLPLAARQQTDTTVIKAMEMLREMVEMVGGQMGDLKEETVALPFPLYPGAEPEAAADHAQTALPGWDRGGLAERFRQGTGIEPHIRNDAHMACLAQVRELGSGRTDTLYVHADYDIGGALFLDGRVYSGARGLAGALGHIQVDPNGSVCTCGRRGCLNTVAGMDHLADLLRPARGAVSLRDIVDDADRGDLVCIRLIEDAAASIASAVEPVVTAFDCEQVVVGGRMTQVDSFLVAFSQKLHKIMFPLNMERSVVAGPYGEDAVARGSMLDASIRMLAER